MNNNEFKITPKHTALVFLLFMFASLLVSFTVKIPNFKEKQEEYKRQMQLSNYGYEPEGEQCILVQTLQLPFMSEALIVRGELTPQQELDIQNAMPVEYLLREQPENLTRWNRFRREMYLVADSLYIIHQDKMSDIVSPVLLYQWLMRTLHAESKYNPAAVNKKSDATGLIQLMPFHWNEYGFRSKKSIIKTHELDQCWSIVFRWFDEEFKGRYKKTLNQIDSFIDVYLVVFLPAFADDPDDKLLFSKKSNPGWYRQNSGYDVNKDGDVFKYEINSRITKKFEDRDYRYDFDGAPIPIRRSGALYASYIKGN